MESGLRSAALKVVRDIEQQFKTGGACWASFVPVDVDQAVSVLAGRDQTDDNGCGADYWTQRAEGADFFKDMPAGAKRELMSLAATLGRGPLHAHLKDCLRAAIGE